MTKKRKTAAFIYYFYTQSELLCLTFLVRGVKPLICVVGLQFGQEPCERPQVNCAQSCCEHGLSFLFKDVIEAFGVLIGSTDTYENVFL